MERQPNRFMSTIYPAAIRDATNALASFLQADGGDVVFVDNATTGCNAVLRSVRLKPGDTVTILSHAYGAVRNTVRFVTEQAGGRIVEANLGFPDPIEDSLVAAVVDTITPKTRLAVIDHITSGSAIVLPTGLIVAACHAAGVPVLIDGAHAPGQIDLDLMAIGADLVCGELPHMAVRTKRLRFSACHIGGAGGFASRHDLPRLRPGLPRRIRLDRHHRPQSLFGSDGGDRLPPAARRCATATAISPAKRQNG